MSFDLSEISECDTKLEDNYEKKEQYYLEEYSLLLDVGVLTKKQIHNHQLYKYLELESFLNVGFNNLVSVYRNYYKRNLLPRQTLIHSIYKLNKNQVDIIFNCLSRNYNKKRTLIFYGQSNTGKTLLAQALTYIFVPGYILRDGGTNVHWLEDIYRKNFILWEEPSIHMTNIEDTKLLLGGEKIAINRKNKPIITRVNDPAVIITTNRQFWDYEYETIVNRSFIFEFYNTIPDNCPRISNAEILSYLLDIYDGRLNCD